MPNCYFFVAILCIRWSKVNESKDEDVMIWSKMFECINISRLVKVFLNKLSKKNYFICSIAFYHLQVQYLDLTNNSTNFKLKFLDWALNLQAIAHLGIYFN